MKKWWEYSEVNPYYLIPKRKCTDCGVHVNHFGDKGCKGCEENLGRYQCWIDPKEIVKGSD